MHFYTSFKDTVKGNDIPFESRILKIAIDFDTIKSKGLSSHEALLVIKKRPGRYDPFILQFLDEVFIEDSKNEVEFVTTKELKPGMILAEDIYSSRNTLLVRKGLEITDYIIEMLVSYESSGIIKSIKVININI